MKHSKEFENFENAVSQIMKVKHSEVKAKLDAEKEAKKRKKAKQSSASVRVVGDQA